MNTAMVMPPYEVLTHTNDLLVIQTNAGEYLKQNNLSESSSVNSFGQFNLGLHVNDNPKKVLDNRASLLALINDYLSTNQHLQNKTATADNEGSINNRINSIYWLNQIHSDKILTISNDKSVMSLTPPSADAMLTGCANSALAIMTADCVPIVVYDKATGQIAAIHAGWQGLASGIIIKTCQKLQKSLDKTENRDSNDVQAIQAWIGASITQPVYEVSSDVVSKILHGCDCLGMNVDAVSYSIVAAHENPDKAWIDLPKLAVLQLQQCGVSVNYGDKETGSPSVSSSPAYACSYQQLNYYSYRRMTHDKQHSTGRMAMLIMRLA